MIKNIITSRDNNKHSFTKICLNILHFYNLYTYIMRKLLYNIFKIILANMKKKVEGRY